MQINNIEDLKNNIDNLVPDDILKYSIGFKYIDGIILSLNKNADIHYDNDFLVRFSIINSNIDLIKYLYEHGINFDKYNGFPLYFSSLCYNKEILEYLIDKCDLYIENNILITKIIVKNDFKLLKKIISKKFDIHIDNELPLRTCIRYNNYYMFKYLIEYNADINKITDDNIKEIIVNNYYNMFKLIIKHKNICNEEFIKYTLSFRRIEIIKQYLLLGIDKKQFISNDIDINNIVIEFDRNNKIKKIYE